MPDSNLKIEKMLQLEKFFEDNIKDLSYGIDRKMGAVIRELYHYTSLKTLFNILENDSLWLSGLHFSNDSTEEKMLGDRWLYDKKYRGDNFIFCVGDEGDSLSQWRGYCLNGGASIGLDIARLCKYRVLYANFDKSKKYKDIDGIALPVLYIPEKIADENGSMEAAKFIIREIEKRFKNNKMLRIEDFVPYIKHHAFHEEKERRLLVSNTNGNFTACIRFRQLENGTKLPYIEIKCVSTAMSDKRILISEKRIKSIIDNSNYKTRVVVPVCSNQEKLCANVREYIKKHPKLTGNIDIRVFCDGHLPIRSIRIAPMSDQKRIIEQVSRYCQSRYWLKDVKVHASKIPYVPSINS